VLKQKGLAILAPTMARDTAGKQAGKYWRMGWRTINSPGYSVR